MKFDNLCENIINDLMENFQGITPKEFVFSPKFMENVDKLNIPASQAIKQFKDNVLSGKKVPRLEPKKRKFMTQKNGSSSDLTSFGVPAGITSQVFGVQIRHGKPSAHALCTVIDGKCYFLSAFDDYNEYNRGIDKLPGSR